MLLVYYAVAAVVGGAVSVATVAIHRSAVLGIPFGFVLGVGTTAVTAWAMREMQLRLGTWFAAGWLVAFGFMMVGQPEGDYVVATDLRGYLLLTTALGLVIYGIWCLQPRGASSRPDAT